MLFMSLHFLKVKWRTHVQSVHYSFYSPLIHPTFRQRKAFEDFATGREKNHQRIARIAGRIWMSEMRWRNSLRLKDFGKKTRLSIVRKQWEQLRMKEEEETREESKREVKLVDQKVRRRLNHLRRIHDNCIDVYTLFNKHSSLFDCVSTENNARSKETKNEQGTFLSASTVRRYTEAQASQIDSRSARRQ